ncbi:MAG: HDOD domain-containing protein [Desulfovibrio sp.]|nr:HDOD domain-containing protein [Desulfovibrio sp.]
MPMSTVPIAELQIGSILSADVKSKQGRLLLVAGTRLEERHIKILKTWGVYEAPVNGAETGQEEPRTVQSSQAQQPPQAPQASPSPQEPKVDISVSDKACLAYSQCRFLLSKNPGPIDKLLMRRHFLKTKERVDSGQVRLKELTFAKCVAAAELPKMAALDPDRIISGNTQLASPPHVFREIIKALQDPKSSVSYLADVIAKDPALTARLLRIVNSPFYGQTQKIDTPARALLILGAKKLTSLAAGIAIMSVFEGIPQSVVNMELFWKHSLSCGVVCKLLALQVEPELEDSLFLAGMLHDIGKLVMLKDHAKHAALVLSASRQLAKPSYEIEKAVWGFTHADIGARLAEQWNFPTSLVNAIRFHHSHSSAADHHESDFVHLADHVACAMEIGSSGAWLFPPLLHVRLGRHAPSLNLLKAILPMAEQQTEEIVGLFLL